MRPIGAVLVVCLLTAIAVLPMLGSQPANADSTFFVPVSISASPGTVTGDVDRVADSDDVRATIAQVDGTAIADALAWLRPTADATGDTNWASAKIGLCVPAGHYCGVNDATVHDGNNTFVASGGTSVEEYFEVEDWGSRPTDINIDGARAWTWVRKNQSADPGLAVRLIDSVGPCLNSIGTGGQAFYNLTGVLEPTSCDSDVWSVAELNSMRVAIGKIQFVGSPAGTATAVGVTVQYDDSDFAATATIRFESVSGDAPTLRYEGSETFPDNVQLEILRAGSWTTLDSNWLTATEAEGSSNLDPADISDGVVQYRISDSDTSGETGGSVSLDRFVIETFTTPPPPGRGYIPAFGCTYDWLFQVFRCTDTTAYGGLNRSVRVDWFIAEIPIGTFPNGTLAGTYGSESGPGETVTLRARGNGFFNVGVHRYMIAMMIQHAYGWTLRVSAYDADDLPRFFVGLGLVVLAIAAAFAFRNPSRGKTWYEPITPGYRHSAIRVDTYGPWTAYRQRPPKYRRYVSERSSAGGVTLHVVRGIRRATETEFRQHGKKYVAEVQSVRERAD